MNSINTNLSALVAQKNMQAQNREMDEAMQRLSSGLRINTAADDAAGSAIASKMDAQVRSLDVAIRNSYDAISMTQTAEGALGEMENILQRVRELAVQASNSTLSQNDRVQIQAEVDALVSEIDKISIPKFPITGNYLIDNGIKNGKRIGQAIKEIQKKWAENDFNLNDYDLTKIIKKFK